MDVQRNSKMCVDQISVQIIYSVLIVHVQVCYSFWVLSALSILNATHYISAPKLTTFILSSQDPINGGIADRPGDAADVFHTHFGVAGLSLLGHEDLDPINPMYCMPKKLMDEMGLGQAKVKK